jgi:hypothetical protein
MCAHMLAKDEAADIGQMTESHTSYIINVHTNIDDVH